jgi:hypothetical protein
VVQGKSYDMADLQLSSYFADLMHLVLGNQIEIDFSQPWHDTGPVFGDPRLAPYRLAQQAFKAVVLSTYNGHCAITGTKIRPVLQAAHIKPVADGGENRIDNGLLLRSDVHTLMTMVLNQTLTCRQASRTSPGQGSTPTTGPARRRSPRSSARRSVRSAPSLASQSSTRGPPSFRAGRSQAGSQPVRGHPCDGMIGLVWFNTDRKGVKRTADTSDGRPRDDPATLPAVRTTVKKWQ